MKIANQNNRAVLLSGDRVVDIEQASDGHFPSDIAALFGAWPEFTKWAQAATLAPTGDLRPDLLMAPSPKPLQGFGIGVNYAKHVAEAGWPVPQYPLVFPKFPTSVTGPGTTIALSGPRVDWEVEAVIVIGREAHNVLAGDAWDHIAGVTIGQDFSDRDVQQRPESHPQFGLGKSFPGYSAIGPILVTPDEFEDRDDIALGTLLNGEQVQNSSTGDLIFPVSALIEYISGIVTLTPGDLIFTGTPSGVGTAWDPPRFLREGDVIESWITGIGQMRHTFSGPETVRV
ncbi:fumarylacetoacetate hydrolase family protein [Gordonia rhizosphera]|uniref:Fumarylacetoacetate hydrolase family protein n=1 Tax=Gordonia rhizosphera NBRC 16068 TaxID=1108045 RepID=K6VNM0_9ACTN|nr:fumarylacetoacetate hydrolase family protein [Gordonia rhizosphera]GAB88510.1 fumarylacetoacetate hydrolase family protein [Gordonia rhizosphera NBRC 16068]